MKVLFAFAIYSVAAYCSTVTLVATAPEIGATNLPVDASCPPGAVDPTCVTNQDQEVVNYTAVNGFDFKGNPEYADITQIDSLTLTFTMTGVDTTIAPYLGFERIWFSNEGTTQNADGFDASNATQTFTIIAPNFGFNVIANTLQTTGELTGQIRNAANILTPVDIGERTSPGISINWERCIPSATVIRPIWKLPGPSSRRQTAAATTSGSCAMRTSTA